MLEIPWPSRDEQAREETTFLRGDASDDILRGQQGNDTLTGGADADRLSGGPGADSATDFNAGEGDATDGT